MATFLLQRAATNPQFTIPVPGETKSQYLPHVCRVANGDLWGVVKGDDSRAIHAWKSTDGGQSFVWQGIVIGPTGSGWEAHACLDPVITYDAASDTVHYLWKGNQTHTGYGGWAIGHATAPGGSPMAITRDPANPILGPAAVQAFFASSLGVTAIGDLYAADAILDPWGVLTVWCGFRDQLGVYRIFRTRGGWNSFTPRAEGLVSPAAPYTFVQAPTVIATASGYTMVFTEGHDSGAPGALRQQSATCAADGNWSWVRSGPTWLPSGILPWEAKLVYGASFLKGGTKYDTPILINGAMQLYYSGAPIAGSTAQGGRADLTPLETATL